jgi:hypothetical protein
VNGEEVTDTPAETPDQAPQEIVLSREAMLTELLDWGSKFIDASSAWRKASYEDDWVKWQRDADAIYPQELKARKKGWQSKVVWPLTAAHRENAQAKRFQTEFSAKPALEYKARPGSAFVPQQVMPGMPPPADQGQMIRDLVLGEREKASYEIARNAQNEEATTYGSGFMRARFETEYQERMVKVPKYEGKFDTPMSPIRHLMGQPEVIGYADELQEVVTYRGVRLEELSIWDVFPDPRALKVKGHPIGLRYRTTYGEIVAGVDDGYNLPEAKEKLKNTSDEQTPEDKKRVETERGIADSRVERPDYARNLECYEIQARLPKKWVLIDGQPIDNPDKLIPARLRIKKGVAVIAISVNDTYDGEPDIEKDDYFPVAGRFYGRGIPEMGKDCQMVASETVNQRLDAGSKALTDRFGVIEKAVFDPKDFEENRNVIRLKAPLGIALTDVKQVIGLLDSQTVDRAAFIEPAEWERIMGERTSITRATLSGSNNQNDGNKTLGGLEMQQSVTGDKMSFLGQLSEFGFQKRMSHRIWSLIYQNYGPEDYAMALGPEKASQLVLLTPEQVAQNFSLIPKGVFETENKPRRQAMVSALQQQYGMFPWFNTLGAAKSQIAGLGEDEATFILPEADAIQITTKAGEMAQGMAEDVIAQEQAQPAKGGPPK